MHVITVVFEIKTEHADEFRVAMEENARLSLELETGCHQFDVAFGIDDSTVCFLYELYIDKAAFDIHLGMAHFKSFDAKVTPWLASKTVHAYTRTWPAA